MAGRQNRLQEKAIDRFIRIVQRGQVDFAIPVGQQLVVSDKAIGQVAGQKDPGPGRSADEARPEVAGCHLVRLSDRRSSMNGV
jgi:hypothetical protein